MGSNAIGILGKISIILVFLAPPAGATVFEDDGHDMEKVIQAGKSVMEISGPVGLYRSPGATSGGCSGTLISEDLYITALHCLPRCPGKSVTFGYYSRETQESFKCEEVIELGSIFPKNDYMIIRLAGKPGRKWGYYEVAQNGLKKGQNLMLFHYPGGSPMSVTKRNCRLEVDHPALIQHKCDTEIGSSGAPVLVAHPTDPDRHLLAGVHSRGATGPFGGNGYNVGVMTSHLIKISKTLKEVTTSYVYDGDGAFHGFEFIGLD